MLTDGKRPRFRLLDTFCGAGGAGMGYYRAGFAVTGVDILPQPHYPFPVIQTDALEYIAEHGHEYDAIHASPPCQGYSCMRHLPWLQGREYPLLIPQVRELLQRSGRLWVIENVADAPLNGALLCGAALGLPVIRHRRFESNILLLFPPCPGHPVLFHGRRNMSMRGRNSGVMGIMGGADPKEALGIDWMTGRETRQAIPPAYTERIGRQLMAALPTHNQL
jgi:DNA (cytosine-5)-methyltransferase 1